MNFIYFRLLGPLQVAGPKGHADIAAHRQRIILAMLLLAAGRVVSVDRLAEAVWDESPPQTAKGQIQICVSALRRSLAEVGLSDVLQTRPPGYLLEVDPEQVDLLVFQRLISEGSRMGEQGNLDEAVELFGRALSLWRGNPLAGLESRVLRAVGARIEEMRSRAHEEHMNLRLRQGAHTEIVAQLFDLVEEYPLREHMRAQLILALYRSGRQAEALQSYREARETLVSELGIEPGAELRELERAILLGDTEYELKPHLPSVAQSLVQTAYTPARILPPDIADFTGSLLAERLQNLIVARSAAEDVAPTVVSVFGKGGIGKTTLAIHAARAVAAEFPDAQLYAKLNGSTAEPLPPSWVLERFLRALGVSGSKIPEGLDERADTFRGLVAGRRVLIVLDDVADEDQVRPLLPGGGPSAVVLTSRHRLTVLPGIHQLECQELSTNDAVELLARIAGPARVYAEPTQALELVELCGRLPLALRIAAGRLLSRPHWTVGKMVERLTVEDSRLDELTHAGQCVRSNIGLSYESLNDAERRLFRLLGMLEAPDFGEWICGPLLGGSDPEGEDVLAGLVAAQLIDVETPAEGHTRFRLHDLVRAFARERLIEEDAEEERRAALHRVLRAWLSVADEAHRRVYGGDHTLLHSPVQRWPLAQGACDRLLSDPLGWYATERSALVAMIRQAADIGADDLCWDLAFSSVTLFEARSYFDDWRTTHDFALIAVRRAGNRLGEASILYSMGALAIAEYRLRDSVDLLLAADGLFAEQGVLHGRALALRNLAFVDRVEGRPAEALARYEQARNWLHELGDVIGEAHVLSGLAQLSLAEQDHAAATRQLHEALELIKSSNNRRVHAQLTYRLGEVSLMSGEVDVASASFAEVLSTVHEAADRIGEAYALYGLGVARMAAGAPQNAAATLRRAAVVAAEAGDPMIHARIWLARAEAHHAMGSHDVAARLAGDVLPLFQRLGAQLWQARTLRLLGDVHHASGPMQSAVAAWREGLAMAAIIESQDAREVVRSLTGRLSGVDSRADQNH
ncbi:AfsR/SARP family transcriptional regulator [Micromonospora echinofusca]|uniref:SARP family transcriptional regulator n=1 Tax=Micromonospora echinofusca TaxID=47858 RepID=A0ABS3VIX2_MICEH|nr:AfsR/SARP family transcriptional regulator [Micromonospora echinofusca]MBO4204418.1 SARP family transcriptional regulator [Micromonospora echinofusca]